MLKGMGWQYKRSKTMESAIKELEEKGRAAKAASRKLAFLSAEVKNKALVNIAEALIDKQDEILAATKADYDEAGASGIGEATLDRLILLPSRPEGIAQDVKMVADREYRRNSYLSYWLPARVGLKLTGSIHVTRCHRQSDEARTGVDRPISRSGIISRTRLGRAISP